ncbi:hypothetical protein Scep_017012 [Stephania cephalantha]|uniref:Uncharacterized protein n=1 Tax=Stephania cephalantha TaxID=152367 RepID=A0AAP0INN2_9MAGN
MASREGVHTTQGRVLLHDSTSSDEKPIDELTDSQEETERDSRTTKNEDFQCEEYPISEDVSLVPEDGDSKIMLKDFIGGVEVKFINDFAPQPHHVRVSCCPCITTYPWRCCGSSDLNCSAEGSASTTLTWKWRMQCNKAGYRENTLLGIGPLRQ